MECRDAIELVSPFATEQVTELFEWVDDLSDARLSVTDMTYLLDTLMRDMSIGYEEARGVIEEVILSFQMHEMFNRGYAEEVVEAVVTFIYRNIFDVTVDAVPLYWRDNFLTMLYI
jgi:hypothetical protein